LARDADDASATDRLCRIALLAVAPALLERDLPAFGEALFEFNRRSGGLFQTVQGSEYGSPEGADMIGRLRGMGLRGVGQSSWGPTLFAIAEPDRLASAAATLEALGAPWTITLTRARNRGYDVDVS